MSDATAAYPVNTFAPMTYRRDRRGETVHRSDCRTLSPGQGSRWDFADGMSADEMLRTIAANRWLRPCKVCTPTANGDPKPEGP